MKPAASALRAGCGLLALGAALQGCAVAPSAPGVLALPGARSSAAQYQNDDAGCRHAAQAQVAPAVEAVNNQAAADALIGVAAGAAIGALVGYGSYGGYGHYANQSAAWGAGTGLMYGGAVGAGYSQSANGGLQQRYDVAYAQCMVARGHQVPALAGPARVAPPPPPPGYGAPRALPPAVPPPGTPPPVGVAPT